MPGSPGYEFIGNGTGAAEQVEDLQVVEFIFVPNDIEKGLPREIRRRTGLESGRRIDDLPLQAATDDPHSTSTALKYRYRDISCSWASGVRKQTVEISGLS